VNGELELEAAAVEAVLDVEKSFEESLSPQWSYRRDGWKEYVGGVDLRQTLEHREHLVVEGGLSHAGELDLEPAGTYLPGWETPGDDVGDLGEDVRGREFALVEVAGVAEGAADGTAEERRDDYDPLLLERHRRLDGLYELDLAARGGLGDVHPRELVVSACGQHSKRHGSRSPGRHTSSPLAMCMAASTPFPTEIAVCR